MKTNLDIALSLATLRYLAESDVEIAVNVLENSKPFAVLADAGLTDVSVQEDVQVLIKMPGVRWNEDIGHRKREKNEKIHPS